MQTKSVETTLDAIQTGNDANLPPLMNPAMLEASDDLTNLSHLNEPAGTACSSLHTATAPFRILTAMQSSRPSSSATCKRRFTHIPASS